MSLELRNNKEESTLNICVPQVGIETPGGLTASPTQSIETPLVRVARGGINWSLFRNNSLGTSHSTQLEKSMESFGSRWTKKQIGR